MHYDAVRALPRREVTPFDILILDEAHRVRRTEAATTAAIREIPRSRAWALSGTPIERDAEDLATLLSLIEPTRFSATYHKLGADALRALAQPLVLRRRKAEVLPDLPRVSDAHHVLDLLPHQQAAGSWLASVISSERNPGDLLVLLGDLLAIL